MKRLLSAVVMLALCSSVAYANVPDPTACEVTPLDGFQFQRMVVMADQPAPSNLADISVFVAATGGVALDNVFVEIFFAGECDASMCYCDGLVLSGYTDANGMIDFNLAAGGCCEVTTAARIVADGLPIRGYDVVVSADYNGASGDCAMGTDDFIAFGSLGWAAQGNCYDTSGDGVINVTDFIGFGNVWGTGQHCTEAP
jgi:hypothetical protein